MNFELESYIDRVQSLLLALGALAKFYVHENFGSFNNNN